MEVPPNHWSKSFMNDHDLVLKHIEAHGDLSIFQKHPFRWWIDTLDPCKQMRIDLHYVFSSWILKLFVFPLRWFSTCLCIYSHIIYIHIHTHIYIYICVCVLFCWYCDMAAAQSVMPHWLPLLGLICFRSPYSKWLPAQGFQQTFWRTCGKWS